VFTVSDCRRDQIRKIVRLPNAISIEYKNHQDSLTDRSSYRNPSLVWRAPAKPSGDKPYFNKPDNVRHQSSDYKAGGSVPAVGGNGWKSRWGQEGTGENGGNTPGNSYRERRERDDSGRVNTEGGGWRKPRNEEDNSSSTQPLKEPPTAAPTISVDESRESSKSLGTPGGPVGDGWTRVQNPFPKKMAPVTTTTK
jgi:hypothetical protein